LTIDLKKLREKAESLIPEPEISANIAHETYCYRSGGPVILLADGSCPICGWRWNPTRWATMLIEAEDLLYLINELESTRIENERLKEFWKELP
jgi:hypothetical protein